MLLLYAVVLLHNSIPHIHIEEETNHAATHHHHHSPDAQHHQEGSEEDAKKVPHTMLDLANLLTHTNLGVDHFSNFTGASFYAFANTAIVAVLLLLSSWLLPRYQVIKPPGNEPDKRLQLLSLSAARRRGPPSFS